MATPARSAKAKARRTPLYHAAKISDYRFRKVLKQFVRDRTASDAARATGLSANSVVAIFQKLRVYFFEVGLFTDIYDGADPTAVSDVEPIFEFQLLEFHFRRIGEKHGLRPTLPDYHFAESHWRFHFHVMTRDRPSEQVHAMMLAHLIEIIRLCGPIGTRPSNLYAGRLAVMRQMDQRILWLERNAHAFRSPEHREALREIRFL